MGRMTSAVRAALLICGALATTAIPAFASEDAMADVQDTRVQLGFGNLLVNDVIGDGYDRWRSGSYTTSRIWGRGWSGEAPSEFGDIIEFRFGGEVMSAESLVAPAAGDRAWAGSLFWGLHTHFKRGKSDFVVGADLVAVGPMTHLDDFQSALHDIIGIDGPSDAVRANQIGDQWIPRFVGEVGRDLDLGGRGKLRPFVEVRAGDETLARAGFDVTFGKFGEGELLVRDWVTGHRYRAVRNHQKGVSFVAGADVAKVFDSVYLPESRGYTLTDTRSRVRAGLHVRGKAYHVFYGVSWLSKEFEAQREDQVVGAVKLDFNF
ncbi:lipid A-modifier LpxR family protein [Shimia haliotis]|uniref:Lipid A deacylase LpxR family protein n=1 Tax=Shimia haliotis TaxID=1280847 RepID=A0A1I4GJU9_9RHOB|nr:lipid A-modifier LpxR family protein [Shimia haliotis]SFL30255.1 hypothetical protein SAMN04488036_10918 [Shimia haliotis]